MQQKSYFLFYQILIATTILINCMGLFVPILRNDDPVLYANIAKHIALSNDWVNLVYNKADWLDKPHFPFWLTALSFKIFGISSFSYILPGFIFHLIGAYYTYLLASYLYNNKEIGALATLLYLSAFHLMISSIDVRAEVYLLGTIIPACYYWLLYDEFTNVKFLFLGAFFSALAIMSKGLFVMLSITSGLFSLWIYKKQLRKLFRTKWLLALLLLFIFILPELITLYLQFDLHPKKLVFNHNNVSGIKWFFWDSQFGRFFNTGPITNNHVYKFHYLFFIHTFLWAFLPWSIIFIFACYKMIKRLLSKQVPFENNIMQASLKKGNSIYLLGSFLPTFILFSISDFQLDHYINIIIPFAAIASAHFIYESLEENINSLLFKVQFYMAIFLFLLVLFFSLLIILNKNFDFIVIAIVLVLFVIKVKAKKYLLNTKLWAIAYSIIAINLVFILLMFINVFICVQYDEGYKIAKYLNKQQDLPIIDYNVDSLTLEFYSKNPYFRINNVSKLLEHKQPYYLVIKKEDFIIIKSQLGGVDNYKIIWQTTGAPSNVVIRDLFMRKDLQSQVIDYIIIQKNN